MISTCGGGAKLTAYQIQPHAMEALNFLSASIASFYCVQHPSRPPRKSLAMGVRKKTRKFAQVRHSSPYVFDPESDIHAQTKRVLGRGDARHAVAKAANDPAKLAQKKKEAAENAVRHVQQAPSSLYFQHNDALVPRKSRTPALHQFPATNMPQPTTSSSTPTSSSTRSGISST